MDLQQEEWCGLCSAPGCGRLLCEGASLLTLVRDLLALVGLLCVPLFQQACPCCAALARGAIHAWSDQ